MHLMHFKHCHKLVSIHFMVDTYLTSPPVLSVGAEFILRQILSGRISRNDDDRVKMM